MTFKLGQLKNLKLKSIWNHEEHDFMPWLAEESHLSALSDAIGNQAHHRSGRRRSRYRQTLRTRTEQQAPQGRRVDGTGARHPDHWRKRFPATIGPPHMTERSLSKPQPSQVLRNVLRNHQSNGRIGLTSETNGSGRPTGRLFGKRSKLTAASDVGCRCRKWRTGFSAWLSCPMVRPYITLSLTEGLRHESSLLR